MRRTSIKRKVTIWITLLMALLFGLLLVFMLMISRQVVYGTAVQTLENILRSNLACVSLVDGQLQIGDGFVYSQNGVSTLVYSRNESLLAGQVPVSYTVSEPFENGLLREVETDSGDVWLVMDFWVPSGWEDGVWVRALAEAPAYQETMHNLLLVALIALPVFIFLTALGGWLLVRRTFRPLDRIIQTVSTINEARDLSGRIGLPPGEDEFSRLAAAFDGMFERLEASFEAERQFAANASHELRTPVSIIKAACEYAEKYDETQEESEETIAMIHRQADRMSAMITQLLSLTRLEQGTEAVRLAPLDLGQLAHSVCEERGCLDRVTLALEPGVMVRGDAALLSRLVQNLIDNAFKYGRPGGSVWVTVRRFENEAQLSVRDNGIGIAPEDQPKVWQRFYQADASRGDEAGAGLGLAMVQQIAGLHGGRMTLESVLGAGSDFTLHLPLADLAQ